MSEPDRPGGSWKFLTGYGHVLVEIARNPEARIRDIAAVAGLTERTVQAIVADLEEAGYLTRTRAGGAPSTPSTRTAPSDTPPRTGTGLARSSPCCPLSGPPPWSLVTSRSPNDRSGPCRA